MSVKSFFTGLFKKKEVEPKKMQVTESQQKYYNDLQKGYRFIQFIHDDIERMKKSKINRAMRRRFEKKLVNGVFTREMVDEYGTKIVEINQFIKDQDIISDKQAEKNKAKAKKEQEKKQEEAEKQRLKDLKKNDDRVDGAKMYEDAKKAEAEKGNTK